MNIKMSILVLGILMLFFACDTRPSRDDMEYFNTISHLNNTIFVEQYVIRGGVHAGDDRYFFVTDSINFRKYIGKTDDKEYFDIVVLDQKVEIEKYTFRNKFGDDAELIDSKTYIINDLVETAKWD